MRYYYIIEGKHRGNLGDVLQGIAAKSFLPSDSFAVDRESLSSLDNKNQGILVGNAWYMHDWENFPPPHNITPIYLSVHIADSRMLKVRKIRDHFFKHSPIGCRDIKTLNIFLGWGIPAYYSGCLTITTNSRLAFPQEKKERYLLVDNTDHLIPDDIIEKLEKRFKKTFRKLSHNPSNTKNLSFDEYSRQADLEMESLLKTYCESSLVITTKIHCALPCIAMGVNVLFIHPNIRDPRLKSLSEFINIYSYNDILTNKPLDISVNNVKLQKRQLFLTELMKQSIASNSNIVRTSMKYKFLKIRILSKINAGIYHAIITCWLKTGLYPRRLKEVYG